MSTLLASSRDAIAAPGAQAVTAYLDSLAEGSRRTMRNALEIVASLASDSRITADGLDWSEMRYSHTSQLGAELGKRYAANTANKILSALRGVLKASFLLGQMTAEDYHRAIMVKNIEVTTLPAGRALATSEIVTMAQGCPATPCGIRDRALLALAVLSGVRRDELVNLDMEDYDPETGVLTVKSGKGNKAREIRTSPELRRELEAWITVRGLEPGPLMLPVPKGGTVVMRRLNAQTVLTALERTGKRVGARDFSPHDCRRTYATNLFDSGADGLIVQTLMGHSKLDTTKRYDRRGDAAAQKAVDLVELGL